MNPTHLIAIRRRIAALTPEELTRFAGEWSTLAHHVSWQRSRPLRKIVRRLAVAPPADTARLCSLIIGEGYNETRTHDSIQELADALAGNWKRMRERPIEKAEALAAAFIGGPTEGEERHIATAPPSAIADICAELYAITKGDEGRAWIDYLTDTLLAEPFPL